MNASARHRIAVILPCYNEEAAIAEVIHEFRESLPSAEIYVYDNASTDKTVEVAREAGAQVRSEPEKGKGNAVRRAFADVDADIYVMADGDGTYDAASAPKLIEVMRRENLDMVVGTRTHTSETAYRPGHVLGNQVFSGLFRRLFRSSFTDILSGYRVFSRRYVKSFPSAAKGFEIELEMSTHAALLRMPVAEVETDYGARIGGGESKLNTYRDGARILRRMLRFLRLHRPRFVYGLLAIASGLLSVLLMIPIAIEFFQTGLVPRVPTVILSAAIMLVAVILFVVGAILDSQSSYFSETKRLAYLRIPPPGGPGL